MEQARTIDEHEFLYGGAGATYQGLFGPILSSPLPPETMTRQRRRAAERAAAKAARRATPRSKV